jgi:cell division protein FtsN
MLDRAWGALVSTLAWHKYELIAAVVVGLMVFGGAYGYRAIKAAGSGETANLAPGAARTAQPERTTEPRPQKPVAAAQNKKVYYDRLQAQEAQGAATPSVSVQPAAPASSSEQATESLAPAKTPAGARPAVVMATAQPLSVAAPPAPAQVSASEPVVVAKPAPAPAEPRPVQAVAASPAIPAGQVPLRSVPAPAPIPQIAPTIAAAHALAADRPTIVHADQPTIVHSERYLPDGTRADAGAPPAPASGIGETRAPALTAPEAKPIVTASAAPRPAVEAPAPAPAPAPLAVAPPPPLAGAPAPLAGAPVALASATPPPAAAAPILAQPATPAAGYFVQVKSDQNRTAAEAELALVAEKYKDALGQIPLSTREADLKDRGIWYRVLAGPVKSHDDADSLCKRLKGAGVQACIVQKFD